MPDHRLIVARGFRIAGGVIGLPSFLAALGLGAGAFLAGSGSGQKPQYLDVSTYGIAGLISNAANGVGGVLSFLNGVAAWALGLLAVLALVAALFAGLLYLVGRGLDASKPWARVLAMAMMAVLAFHSLVALALLRGGARLLDACVLAAVVYALWVLGWKFRDPIPADRPTE
ncbi:MAG: hypothetical protein ACREE0_07010 [Phenylobacterium sp.]